VRSALVRGRDALVQALPAADGQPARGDVRTAILALAGFRLPGGLPGALDEDALVAAGRALVARIDARLDAAAEEPPGAADAAAGCRGRAGVIARLVGQALPLAPRFDAAGGAALDASIARGRLPDGAAAAAWLNQAGRADPGAQRLRIAVDVCEAAADRSLFDFRLAQLPDYADEPWVALALPTADDRRRLCLATTAAGPRCVAGAVAGLVLGSWNDAVPRMGAAAGIAVHFDAADSRAPQAVLLCTAPDAFGFELVRDTVAQTLDLARLRMVGPETL